MAFRRRVSFCKGDMFFHPNFHLFSSMTPVWNRPVYLATEKKKKANCFLFHSHGLFYLMGEKYCNFLEYHILRNNELTHIINKDSILTSCLYIEKSMNRINLWKPLTTKLECINFNRLYFPVEKTSLPH